MIAAIVLSAYNGEKDILRQLCSLLEQTRPADLVVISDDCSADGTVEAVSRFIRENKLQNWSVSVREHNVGWMRNFHDLILSAPADLVFPCDQDDIWHPTKLAEMTRVMEEHPEIDLLASDYRPLYLDDTRRISSKITEGMDNSGRLETLSFDEHFMNVLRPGCTFAVRKSFCEKLAPCWDAGLPHDAMLWRSALAAGSAAIYHKELITWRRYDSSSSNPNSASDQYEDKKRLMLDFYVENCSSHLLYLEKLRSLIEQGSLSVSERTDRILRESEAFEQAWKDALSSHNALRLAGDILRYRRFFLSVRNALYQAYISLRTRQSARKLP